LELAYRSVLSAILKLGFRQAAINVSWRGSPKIGLHSRIVSKLEAKNTAFVNEKRGLFFAHSTVRTFFWPSPKPPKWLSKVAPKNTQRDVKSHVLSAFPIKKSCEHRKSPQYGEMGAAFKDGGRASKIGFLDGTVEIVFFFSEPSPIRPKTKNYSL